MIEHIRLGKQSDSVDKMLEVYHKADKECVSCGRSHEEVLLATKYNLNPVVINKEYYSVLCNECYKSVCSMLRREIICELNLYII